MRRNVHLYTSETLILIAVVGISSLGYGFIAPLRALYARSVGASSFDISLMMSAASLTGFFFTPLVGLLTDRVGSRLVLLTALCLHGGLVLLYNASFYISAGLLVLAAVVCLLFLSNHLVSKANQQAGKKQLFKGSWAKEFSLTYAIAVLTALPMGLGGSIWRLYMQDRGASLIEIGLSYSTFAIPGMVFTPLIGRISDKQGRWHPLFYGLLLSGLVYLLYALPMSPWWIIMISTLEGLVVALARNAADGILADMVPPEKVGMIQANYSAMGTGGSFIGSVASGEQYSFGPGIPFLALGTVFVASSSLLIIPGVRKMVNSNRVLSLDE